MNHSRITLIAEADHRLLPLHGTVTVIGRSAWCHIRIADRRISRRHCKLTLTDDGLWVHDLASANGTYVNDVRIPQTRLSDGDRLRVGKNEFRVEIVPVEQAAPAAPADTPANTLASPPLEQADIDALVAQFSQAAMAPALAAAADSYAPEPRPAPRAAAPPPPPEQVAAAENRLPAPPIPPSPLGAPARAALPLIDPAAEPPPPPRRKPAPVSLDLFSASPAARTAPNRLAPDEVQNLLASVGSDFIWPEFESPKPLARAVRPAAPPPAMLPAAVTTPPPANPLPAAVVPPPPPPPSILPPPPEPGQEVLAMLAADQIQAALEDQQHEAAKTDFLPPPQDLDAPAAPAPAAQADPVAPPDSPTANSPAAELAAPAPDVEPPTTPAPSDAELLAALDAIAADDDHQAPEARQAEPPQTAPPPAQPPLLIDIELPAEPVATPADTAAPPAVEEPTDMPAQLAPEPIEMAFNPTAEPPAPAPADLAWLDEWESQPPADDASSALAELLADSLVAPAVYSDRLTEAEQEILAESLAESEDGLAALQNELAHHVAPDEDEPPHPLAVEPPPEPEPAPPPEPEPAPPAPSLVQDIEPPVADAAPAGLLALLSALVEQPLNAAPPEPVAIVPPEPAPAAEPEPEPVIAPEPVVAAEPAPAPLAIEPEPVAAAEPTPELVAIEPEPVVAPAPPAAGPDQAAQVEEELILETELLDEWWLTPAASAAAPPAHQPPARAALAADVLADAGIADEDDDAGAASTLDDGLAGDEGLAEDEPPAATPLPPAPYPSLAPPEQVIVASLPGEMVLSAAQDAVDHDQPSLVLADGLAPSRPAALPAHANLDLGVDGLVSEEEPAPPPPSSLSDALAAEELDGLAPDEPAAEPRFFQPIVTPMGPSEDMTAREAEGLACEDAPPAAPASAPPAGQAQVKVDHLRTSMAKPAGKPLHDACRTGNRQLAALLLSKGADVNAREQAAQATPLHLAAGGGHMGVIDLLLRKGADLHARDGHGATPLDWALAARKDAAAAALREAGA